MAGTIDLIQRCYIGIEMRANILHFNPVLPDDLDRVQVQLRYRRQVLDVEVTHEVLRISSRSFTVAPITIAYRGHFRDVAPGDTYEFRLLKPRERNRDENRGDGPSPPRVPVSNHKPHAEDGTMPD
jgi:alpha,alpha-trehalase